MRGAVDYIDHEGHLATGADSKGDFAARVSARLGSATLTWAPAWFELDWAADYWLEDIPAFLSASYEKVTQELRLAGTVGGRCSLDERQGAGLTSFGQPFDAAFDYDRLDWKLGFEFDVRDDALLYTTIQTAYQPGTYNLFPATPTQSNEVNPAKLVSWTVGSKNRLASNRAQLNVEAFYYDYRDLFVRSFNLNTALPTTFNAERVEIYGAQVDLLWRPVEPGQLNLSLGALHARNREFVVPPGVDIGTPRRDWAGEPLQYAPDWTVTAGYQHDFRAARGYLRARLETRYESAFWGTFTQSRGTRQGAYFKSDASLTWYSGDDRWSAGLWARNLENEPVLAATTTAQSGPYADAFLEPPRTWGARATLRF